MMPGIMMSSPSDTASTSHSTPVRYLSTRIPSVFVLFRQLVHVERKLLLRMDDFHVSSAQHIGRAKENRIADFFRCLLRVAYVMHHASFRHGDEELFQLLLEEVPVFCKVDALKARAQNPDPSSLQSFGEIDGGLTAELDDDAQRILQLHHMHHILQGQGLEVELVGYGEIRGDGLGIVVYDDGLIAQLSDGPDAVDRGIVKLHTLTDAYGTGAQNDDLFPV